jgi:hypothetical protein
MALALAIRLVARCAGASITASSRSARFTSAPHVDTTDILVAGTIFAATKVPLCIWFRALTTHPEQRRLSSIELGRGLASPSHGPVTQAHAGDDGADATKALAGGSKSTTPISAASATAASAAAVCPKTPIGRRS